MSKKFTDSKKWNLRWFRTLPPQAKLAWIFLCDECEGHGYFKIDYELASFKLAFDLNPTLIKLWFDKKIYFINSDEIVIIPYFNFQYGESKDTWSAKIRAKEKLQDLGFRVVDNKAYPPDEASATGEEQPGKPSSDASNLPAFEPLISDGIESLYHELYPRKEGLTPAIKALTDKENPKTLISSVNDLTDLEKAIKCYIEIVKGREEKHIKTFGTFALEWRDYLNPIASKPKSANGGLKSTQKELQEQKDREKNISPDGANKFLDSVGAKSVVDAVKKFKSKGVSA